MVNGYPHHEGGHRKSNTGKIVLFTLLGVALLCGAGIVLSVVGIGATGKAVSDEMDRQAAEKGRHIQEVTCTPTPLGGFEVSFKVVNSSDKSLTYFVEIDMMAADGKTRLGEAVTIVSDVAPGITANEKTFGTGKMMKGSTCVVRSVS